MGAGGSHPQATLVQEERQQPKQCSEERGTKEGEDQECFGGKGEHQSMRTIKDEAEEEDELMSEEEEEQLGEDKDEKQRGARTERSKQSEEEVSEKERPKMEEMGVQTDLESEYEVEEECQARP